MKLETKKYKGIDVIRLPFKIDPSSIIMQMILVVVEAIVPTTAMAFATAYFVDTAIRIFEDGKAIHTIYLPLVILIVIIGIVSIIGNLTELIEVRIRLMLERHMMPAIIDIQARLAYKHIENANSWELIERVGDEMSETFLDGIRSYGAVVRSIISIISIGALIMSQVWWATLIIAVFSIPLFGISLWSGKKNYDSKVQTRKYERRYSYYSDEVLTNREAVEERTLFGYVTDVTKLYYEDFEKSRDIQLKVLLKTKIAMKATSISFVFIILLIAFTFINPVIQGDVSPGMFIGIITALFGMVETLGWQLQDAAKNITESNEYMNDLTTFVALDLFEGATDLPDKEPIRFKSLEFINVRFKYPNSPDYILDGLSLTLECGKHYAFVGANGAGKTTITKLLTRLYEEYEGEILINGRDIKTYPVSSIKSLFSVVYQDYSRYQISMADNIALGDVAMKIDKKQLLNAASKVGLQDTIEQLQNGIDTPLGRLSPDAMDISGGQWQKVAIARSLLSRAPIKILDEPTSALDPIAENQLYQEFEELMKGKTTIFISHRLGSTKLADEILVIDKGKVVEIGNHNQLMKEKGLYAHMFDSQRKWYE